MAPPPERNGQLPVGTALVCVLPAAEAGGWWAPERAGGQDPQRRRHGSRAGAPGRQGSGSGSGSKRRGVPCACGLLQLSTVHAAVLPQLPAVLGPMVAANQGGPMLPYVVGAWATALLTGGMGLFGGGAAKAAA